MESNEIPESTNSMNTYINRSMELADPNRSYNLVETLLMKKVMEQIDQMVKQFQDVRSKIAEQYSRTIGEYQEAEILESDGVVIKLLKQGRRSLNEPVARKLFPEECKAAQVETVVFDTEKFKIEHPTLYAEYTHFEYSLTLTALESHLSDEEVLKVITRAPNTYGVDLKGE